MLFVLSRDPVLQYSFSFFVNTQNWSVINTNSTHSFLELLRHFCVRLLLSRYILGHVHISLFFCVNLEQSTEFRLPPLFIGKDPAVRQRLELNISPLYFLISKSAFLIITRTKARIWQSEKTALVPIQWWLPSMRNRSLIHLSLCSKLLVCIISLLKMHTYSFHNFTPAVNYNLVGLTMHN